MSYDHGMTELAVLQLFHIVFRKYLKYSWKKFGY